MGVPSAAIVECIPAKFIPFAPQKATGSYSFSSTEEHEYKRSYRMSYYAHTQKKSGYDCLRHYEILASGTVPWFGGLEDASQYTLAHFPKQLLIDLREMVRPFATAERSISSNGDDAATAFFENDENSENSAAAFDQDEYFCKAQELLTYTKQRLATIAVARYVLQTMKFLPTPNNVNTLDDNYLIEERRILNNANILYLGAHGDTDYVRDLVLHGLKELVEGSNGDSGGKVVDFVKPAHLYMNDSTSIKNWGNEELYGLGFTYSRWLRDEGAVTDGSDVLKRLKNKGFDVIIYGSVHRGMPWLKEVMSIYEKERIAFIDGEDEHGWCEKSMELMDKGYYFMREIPAGECPAQ
jgi:hypothetical protein